MRSEIPFLLALAALTIGGCDKPSPESRQANAQAPAKSSPPAAAGSVDRSHKGQAAPDIGFTDADGKRMTIASFKGRPVLLNLWATWCAPCIAEMPTLDALAGSLDGSVAVLPVSQDLEGAAKAGPFFAKAGYRHLKTYLDPDLGFSTGLGVNLPTTILYDKTGHELWRVTGGMDWSGDKARALVDEATR